MLLSLILTISLSFTKVIPSGMEVSQNGDVFLAVTSDPLTDHACLDIFIEKAGKSSFDPVPVLSVSRSGGSVIGGALKRTPKGEILLFYTLSNGSYDGKGEIYMRKLVAGLAPNLWSEPVLVGEGCVHGTPIICDDGSIVLPVSLWGPYCIGPEFEKPTSPRGIKSYVSTDGGSNWISSNTIRIPERREAAYNNPWIVKTPSGSLKMVSRSCDTGFAYYSESEDGGRTWNTAFRFAQNPDRDFALVNVSDKQITFIKCFPIDVLQFYSNRDLRLYRSEDAGKTWFGGVKLTDEDYIENPVACTAPNGNVLVAYSVANKDCSEVKMVSVEGSQASSPVTIISAMLAKDAFLAKTKVLSTPRTNWGSAPIKLGTYNIQRQGWGGGPSWDERKEAVIHQFKEHQWDIVGTQEASREYVEEINKGMGGIYDYYANYPDFMGSASRSASENPVMWKKSRFELLECGVLEYAINMSVFAGARSNKESYGAEYHKATLWGHFKDKANGMEFYHVNLHFPVRSTPAQEAEAKILRDYILELSHGLPVVITGDFNCTETSSAYHYLTEFDYLADSMTSLPQSDRINAEYVSLCGYGDHSKLAKTGQHLDHIFYTPASVKIKSWELDIETMHNGKYASDHLPVTVTFEYSN